MATEAEQPPIGEVPPTHLGVALALAIVCFLPLGLLAAWYGWRTARAVEAGDLVAARRDSTWASRWMIAAFVVGVVVDLGIMLVLGLLGAFPSA